MGSRSTRRAPRRALKPMPMRNLIAKQCKWRCIPQDGKCHGNDYQLGEFECLGCHGKFPLFFLNAGSSQNEKWPRNFEQRYK